MNIALFAAVLSVAAPSRAASVVYDHPALKAKLTVHTISGAARPDAVSYEGPMGFYLVKNEEIFGLRRIDGWTQWGYDEHEFTPAGFSSRKVSYEKPVLAAYGDDACVKSVETMIAALRYKGKEEAPDEFAARVASLRKRVAHARGTFQSMTTMTQSYGGMVKDPAVVAAQETVIASAEKSVAESAALRVTGEADAARTPASAGNPNPKADFYWQQSLKLDAASQAASAAQYALDQQPIPNY